MMQATMGSFSQLLEPFEGAGIIVLVGVVLILFFEAAVVISTFIATLPDRNRPGRPRR
jgi:hypothetical protein